MKTIKFPAGEFDIPVHKHTVYRMWDGEVECHAYIHEGTFGHYSAAIVAIRLDDPIETFTYSGYTITKPGMRNALRWIALTLNTIGTGKGPDEGKFTENITVI